jgi:conjugative transposon TraK protein
MDMMRSKVYVMANGKLLEAVSTDRKNKMPVEVRDHVRVFHELFFSLEPDEDWNRSQITRSMYLCDSSARMQYRLLSESGYYAGVVSGNISQRLIVDSISVDQDAVPWYVRFYGRLSIIRPTSIVTRSLITEGYVRDLQSISDHNPHGLLMEKWKILENKDLNIQAR